VSICYEDVFATISRQFVRRGADLLITLTNDAWYAESSGSRQHMVHAVFRAAENRRPLLRSGNNSDTCLILPNGKVTGLLYDPQTGNRFLRGAKPYAIPVRPDLGLTFYCRYGDLFAMACTAVLLAVLLAVAVHWFRRKEKLFKAVDAARRPAG
jgi:apolipoprotein N-acyltransferase